MSDQVDLFGNGSSSKSNNSFGGGSSSQGGFGGQQPSQGGFQSGGLPFKNSQQEPPKKSYKKLWVTLGVLVTLGIVGVSSTLVYKHNQKVAIEKKAKEDALKDLQEKISSGVSQFSLAEISDTSETNGISLWVTKLLQ